MNLDRTLLDALCALADDAAAAILEVYAGGFEVLRKADDSPVTAADLAADKIIRAGLEALAPGLPILSEEGPEPRADERLAWSTYWLVDPLDGTKGFANRNGEFSVNIALIDSHQPVLGVVCAPVSGECYMAADGTALKRTNGSAFTPIHVRHKPDRPRFARSRSRHSRRTDMLIAHIGGVDAVALGSSLKSCLVAEGAADFSPAFGPTSEWDTAAAQCVLECAGGYLLDVEQFAPLRYNCTESLENPRYFACGADVEYWMTQIKESGCTRNDG